MINVKHVGGKYLVLIKNLLHSDNKFFAGKFDTGAVHTIISAGCVYSKNYLINNKYDIEKRLLDELLAEKADDSARQIQRYVRLTKLIPVLLEQVDSGKLKLVPAADYISHLTEKEQTYLALVMERDEVSPSVGQAKRMKELSAEGKLEDNIIDLVMREEKPLERKVTLDGKWVQRRFPRHMTPQQIMDRINKALDLLERSERRKQEQSR